MASAFQLHVAKWQDCTRCKLHKVRQRVVLVKGTLPCDILFVGEAPGESEDVIGRPFVGPAGKLLSDIIMRSGIAPDQYAMTNLVACIPRDDTPEELGGDGSKLGQPPVDCIEACSERLIEIAKLCKPKQLVWVGELAAKWGPMLLPPELIKDAGKRIKLIHPAAVLRMNVSQQGLAVQRCVVALNEMLDEL